MRSMLYVRKHFPTAQYEAAFLSLWTCYWGEHMDLSKSEVLRECLRRTFSDGEAGRILEKAGSKEYKEMLTKETGRLVEKGAFGAPWFLVTDGEGKEENFFGSDRYVAVFSLVLGFRFRWLWSPR